MNNKKSVKFLAHYRKSDGQEQSVRQHLEEVANLAEVFAGKIGLGSLGKACGLLHDFGKYSGDFQAYLRSAIGQLNPDADEFVDAEQMRGKIDHSTAGAQYIWNTFQTETGAEWQIARQIMALCVASHHSGIIDCLSPVGKDVFIARMHKSDNLVHLEEVCCKADKLVTDMLENYHINETISHELSNQLRLMSHLTPAIGSFNLGMLARFLFSALIDADRLNSAEFEDSAVKELRSIKTTPDWNALIIKLEKHLVGFKQNNKVDQIRANISAHCLAFSSREKGLYSLTVPTGGGKTLASLRFALHHAKEHKMDRIIYVIPYTSIIDQNAAVVRSIFENENTIETIVLEHHSNLTPERDTWRSKILSENWGAPIIYTTAVQFLETLFASGTRGARRMHQLANAVIIFDEIQTLPIRTTHLFNNAINFLVGQCGSTALFCTATQPILNQVNKDRGAAQFSSQPEMIPDVSGLFGTLRRVEVADIRKNGGWQDEEIAGRAIQELGECGSVLIIVNTKASAQNIYRQCKAKISPDMPVQIFHLSTSMCPSHRMTVLDAIKPCLNLSVPRPVICISTQLIEAGVDIDFGCVIRCMAGLDSIAQAAGRCNRNGARNTFGKVFVINPANENLPDDIKTAKEKAERVIDEFKKNPEYFDGELIGPKAMELYYQYYFFERAEEMSYPVGSKQIGREGDLFSLLSSNNLSVKAYSQANNKTPAYHLRQSFMSAAEVFKAIDAPTEGIIVPYRQEGKEIISKLCAAFDVKKQRETLMRAQRYSVNVFPNILRKLRDCRCIHEVQEGSGIMYLDGQYYSDDFGVSVEKVEPMKLLNV